MPVTLEENQKYQRFVSAKAKELGLFDFDPKTIVWHCTNGPGFLGIPSMSAIEALALVDPPFAFRLVVGHLVGNRRGFVSENTGRTP